MKKTSLRMLCLLLAVVMVFAAGCTPDDADPTQSGTTPPTQGAGDPTAPTVDPNEYTLPKEEGYNQITFYWAYPGSIENCDVWVWWDGKEGSGYTLHECSYGAKAVINIPVGISEVGFIVRRDCSDPGGSAWGSATKDYGEDRFAVITGEETFIWLKSGDVNQYFSTDGGKTLEIIKKITIAGMVALDKIQYNLTPKTKITSLEQIKVLDGDREVPITGVTSLNKEVVNGTITLGEQLDISKTYTLQIEGFDPMPVVPTAVFDSPEFIEQYTYDGDDLGPVINGTSTTFKVWAPTASKVVLNLFEKGNDCDAFAQVEMVRGDKGVWSHTQENCGHGTYYTYSVTTSVGTQEATDPYAKAAGVNGDRSMVIDLDSTDPAGWENDRVVTLEKYTDAVIWEVHVRDFSNKITSSKYPGKYLAFTERGLTNGSGVVVGVDYLLNLGVTHVHLLPVYDYATVDERNPDSQFNWGYDPKNYNVPEGSYSTDPYNGEVRVNEFKLMVQSMHNDGLGVIMDVVYNHTYDANSAFNRIVPYYYYRYTPTGANSSASGCGNDTASERKMFRKFMVDSVTYWAKEYNLDGFRFDLMGLHDLETMRQIEEAVHKVNPNAIIYGEGWTMGSTIDGSAQANQGSISKIEPSEGAAGSIAVFNDAIRDGLKGSVFMKDSQGYISGNYAGTANNVQFGIRGGSGAGPGWTVKNGAVINYMSAHDNNTLWDKLLLSNPDNSDEERAAMNRLGAAILMISKGTPFMQAGEEMLRTKAGDENSYKSSDAINNIDWEVLKEGSMEYEMMLYYKGLMALRARHEIFRSNKSVAISFGTLTGGGMTVVFDDHMGNKALVLINPTESAVTHELSGQWNLLATGTEAGADTIATEDGAVTVDSRSVRIYVNY